MIQTVVITNSQQYEEVISQNNYQGSVLLAVQTPDVQGIKKIEKGDLTIVKSNSNGIANNRNIGLHFTTKEITVCADDDVVFYDNYLETVKQAYQNLPQADIIIFDLDGVGKLSRNTSSPSRIRWYNFMRFGGARFSYKTKSILKNNITFNTLFGASVFGSGEDTLFLLDSLRKGLKIYYYPQALGQLTEKRDSTWFSGFDKKYYFDKGALYYAISPYFYKLLLLRHVIKTVKKSPSLSIKEAYLSGLEGSKYYKEYDHLEHVYKKR